MCWDYSEGTSSLEMGFSWAGDSESERGST